MSLLWLLTGCKSFLKEIYHKVTRVGAIMIEDTTQSFFWTKTYW